METIQVIVETNQTPVQQAQVNLTGQTIVTNEPITLATSTTEYNRLDQLLDVTEGNAPDSGMTLVYDLATDKYILQRLSANSLVGDLDGGSF